MQHAPASSLPHRAASWQRASGAVQLDSAAHLIDDPDKTQVLQPNSEHPRETMTGSQSSTGYREAIYHNSAMPEPVRRLLVGGRPEPV